MSQSPFVKSAVAEVGRLVGANAPDGKLNYSEFALDVTQFALIQCALESGSAQPELVIPYLANVLTAWSSYILEAKSICHYRKDGRETGYRNGRDKYLKTLQQAIVDARSLAVEEKSERQRNDTGADSDVPSTIRIPDRYTNDDLLRTDVP